MGGILVTRILLPSVSSASVSEWKNESNKSLGYQIQDGKDEFLVDLGLKKSE